MNATSFLDEIKNRTDRPTFGDVMSEFCSRIGMTYFLDRHGDAGVPASFHGIPDGLSAITAPVAMWWHPQTLCLVVEDVSGKRVGFKSTSFRLLGLGLIPGRLEAILDGLISKLRGQGSAVN